MDRLASTVYLTDEDGATVCLLAGSVPTAAQAARITNPKAWEGGEAPVVEPPSQAPTDPSGPKKPPRHGPGSSREAWTSYALTIGFAPEAIEDMDRNAIISAIEA